MNEIKFKNLLNNIILNLEITPDIIYHQSWRTMKILLKNSIKEIVSY